MRARLDAAHLEQAVDEAAETLALGVDLLGRVPDACGVEVRRRVRQPAGERPDAGDGRPQVVRDGVEDRTAERIALAGHLGGGQLGAEHIAAVGDRELVRRQREEAPGAAPGARLARSARGVDRPGDLVAGVDRDQVVGRRVVVGGHGSRAGVEPEPLGGVFLRAHQRPRRSSIRRGRFPGPGHGAAWRVGLLNPDRVHLRVHLQPERDLRRGLLERRGHRHVAAHRHERDALAHATVSLLGALPLEGRQTADHDGDEEEQQQAEPLGGVRDREA